MCETGPVLVIPSLEFLLVPKLCLGMTVSWKLRFSARWRNRVSSASAFPNREFGNEAKNDCFGFPLRPYAGNFLGAIRNPKIKPVTNPLRCAAILICGVERSNAV
jgi:hypothetical protein